MIDAAGDGRVEAAATAAFGAVQRVDALMRPLTVGSDVWRISAAAPGRVVRVDPWTFAVLELATLLHRESAGTFDPCRPTRPGRLGDLELSAPDGVVCHANVALDLGGIAKGFAVDRAVDELKRHGCVRGIVNVGGDLRCFGSNTHVVSLRTSGTVEAEVAMSARSPTAAATAVLQLAITDAALAVSGPRSDSSPSEHVGYYVGGTGEDVVGRWTAVVAREAVVADALCKCVMLAPSAIASEMLQRHRARLVQTAS